MFIRLATCLAKWSSQMGLHIDGLERQQLSDFIDWLHECANALAQDSWTAWAVEHTPGRGGYSKFGPAGQRYSSSALLHFMAFSLNIKIGGESTFQTVLRRGIQCLPPQLQGAIMRVLEGAPMPSASTICRGRIGLDTAWMLHMRDKHNELIEIDSVLWGALDSSPQGNRNWEMAEYFTVEGSRIAELCALLQDVYDDIHVRDLDEIDLDAHVRLVGKAASFVFRHRLPPAGLGVRHADLPHTKHAFLHALRLENHDWARVIRLTKLFFPVPPTGVSKAV